MERFVARLENLIASVEDLDLRAALSHEVKKLKEQTRFGLVYERHLPETVCLAANSELRVGDPVLLRRAAGPREPLNVQKVTETHATVGVNGGPTKRVRLRDLLVVRDFRDPVFPTLTPIGTTNQNPGQPAHAVISGENYHALQILRHTCRASVDCIYIDPPYNTGDANWKYNNRYVDKNDAWRHSKWLSFMERRLKLARHLL
jgi:adenine-specific DNA-methyltransferase